MRDRALVRHWLVQKKSGMQKMKIQSDHMEKKERKGISNQVLLLMEVLKS